MNVEKMLDPVKKYLDNAFLPDFLRSEENINQINDAYLSNNQKLYRECIMLRMGNKTMEECSAFEIHRLVVYIRNSLLFDLVFVCL